MIWHADLKKCICQCCNLFVILLLFRQLASILSMFFWFHMLFLSSRAKLWVEGHLEGSENAEHSDVDMKRVCCIRYFSTQPTIPSFSYSCRMPQHAT